MNSPAAFVQGILRMASRAATQARHDYESMYCTLRQRLREAHGPDLRDLRVLDFGCGYKYPLLLLLAQDVREVVGLEVMPVWRDGLLKAVTWRGGLRRPQQVVLGWLRYLETTYYHKYLKNYLRDEPNHDRLNIVRYDGHHFPFDDSSFDCVVSNAVLQQLPLPLEGYAREIARVLKPGGSIDLAWHNFYSWSGNFLVEDWNRRYPWGHLLGGRHDPCLNRISPEQAVEAFSHDFIDLRLHARDCKHRIAGKDSDYQPEAKEYLTPERQARLSQYPPELLLTRGYILWGRRPLLSKHSFSTAGSRAPLTTRLDCTAPASVVRTQAPASAGDDQLPAPDAGAILPPDGQTKKDSASC
jgi:SAM-dependent methyltransferase